MSTALSTRMPQGSKASYTSKQKRQARHIAASAKKRGASSKRAAQIGYATVNKQDHGGKKSGSGRGKTRSKASSRAGGRASHAGRGVGAHKATARKATARKATARKASHTTKRSTSKRGGSRAAHARAGRAAHRT